MGRLLWQIHAAPGHDPHSIVLFEPTHGILMSADALWENGFGVVFPELEGESAFEEVGATIDLIQRLAPCIVIPGHGRVFTDLPSALERARRRLDGFVNNPTKHANHAAKVLIKFKLLEEQHVRSDDLIHWACATRYFAQLHEKYFSDLQQATWVQQIFDDLVRVGAARREDGWLLNC